VQRYNKNSNCAREVGRLYHTKMCEIECKYMKYSRLDNTLLAKAVAHKNLQLIQRRKRGGSEGYRRNNVSHYTLYILCIYPVILPYSFEPIPQRPLRIHCTRPMQYLLTAIFESFWAVLDENREIYLHISKKSSTFAVANQ